jgi:hypothetical protein
MKLDLDDHRAGVISEKEMQSLSAHLDTIREEE